MERPCSGGSWMIPNFSTPNHVGTSNQDLSHLCQHHLLHQQQQQQQHHQQQQQQQQQQRHQHQSLASHFHLLHLVENLSEGIESGTREQHADVVSELSSHFEKCQRILNSISGSINAKAVTVEGQRQKLEETEQLLNQRRDLIAKYRSSVEQL